MTDSDRPASEARPSASSLPRPSPESATIRPGHFFTGVTLALAAGTAILLRAAPAIEIALAVATVAGAGLAAFGLYRTLAPLTTAPGADAPAVALGRRSVLERDKALTLRSLKELEFDRAMGKIAEADFAEMRARLRARAVRLMQQLEGGDVYRQTIERDLQERLGASSETPEASIEAPRPSCAQCGVVNETDARFCKMCGHALA